MNSAIAFAITFATIVLAPLAGARLAKIEVDGAIVGFLVILATIVGFIAADGAQ